MRRWVYAAILSLAVFAFLGSPVAAFHDAGVAHCNGCHTMHNSEDGAQVVPNEPNGVRNLLRAESASDVCLGCHADGLGSVFVGDCANGPGVAGPEKGSGNFIYLTCLNINDGHGGGASPIVGDAAGHNLVAPAYSLAADGTLTQAPGGTYPAANMSCTSCHDPHGNGDFRLLYGDYQTGFSNPAPVASGLSIFFGSEGPSSHTAYQDGMSEWCANCHGAFHDQAAGSPFRHVSGFDLSSQIVTNYNAYNGTSDPGGGVQTASYLPEVPFESVDVTTGSTAGPNGTGDSQVMCMSCHRAHATSAPDAGRWDFNVTFLHEDGVESGSYALPDPYADVDQRSLCNKCHIKDGRSQPAP